MGSDQPTPKLQHQADEEKEKKKKELKAKKIKIIRCFWMAWFIPNEKDREGESSDITPLYLSGKRISRKEEEPCSCDGERKKVQPAQHL